MKVGSKLFSRANKITYTYGTTAVRAGKSFGFQFHVASARVNYTTNVSLPLVWINSVLFAEQSSITMADNQWPKRTKVSADQLPSADSGVRVIFTRGPVQPAGSFEQKTGRFFETFRRRLACPDTRHFKCENAH